VEESKLKRKAKQKFGITVLGVGLFFVIILAACVTFPEGFNDAGGNSEFESEEEGVLISSLDMAWYGNPAAAVSTAADGSLQIAGAARPCADYRAFADVEGEPFVLLVGDTFVVDVDVAMDAPMSITIDILFLSGTALVLSLDVEEPGEITLTKSMTFDNVVVRLFLDHHGYEGIPFDITIAFKFIAN